MDKKRLIIFSSLILILSFGLFFVSSIHADYSGRTIVVTMPQSPTGVDNVTKGDLNETINFTITVPSAVNGSQNVTEISFELPGNVIMNDLNNLSNGTGLTSGWNCESNLPAAANHTYYNWTCTNMSGDSQLSGGDSIAIWFNYTANSTGTEEDVVWNIKLCGDHDNCNTTTYRTRIDDYAPRLIELNITDGNTTLSNGSSSAGRTLNENASLMYGATYTIYATINDTQLNGVNVFCGNDTNISATLTTFNKSGETSTVGLNRESHIDLYYYTATMPSACVQDGNVTNFVIGVNDTVNNFRQYNETSISTDAAFSFTANSTLMRIQIVNVTDGIYTRTALDGTEYLPRANGHTIHFKLLGEKVDANSDAVSVYYNETGSMIKDLNGSVDAYTLHLLHNATGSNTVHNLSALNASDAAVEFVTYFNFSLGNDTNTIQFYILANDSNNYVTIGGPYSYIIDDSNPASPAMTVPSDRTIGLSDTITYSCLSSDVGSGLSTWEWTLTKPDSTTLTNAGGTSTSDSISYSSSSINQAGVYTLKCTANDAVGHETAYTTTSTQTFTVLYSSGAGGGGAAAAVTPTFDIDFSGTVTEGTMKAKQGVIKTFSFDGATEHTMKFKEVGTDSVIIEIASDPVTVELSIGETKEVDVNNDGISDLSVTLNSIENDQADITVKKLEEGAKIVKAEEEAARGVEEGAPTVTEPTVTEPEVKSKAWVWILVLILVVVGVVAYFVTKKK